ncbi:unnamed protein product [Merluccius merluccius]
MRPGHGETSCPNAVPSFLQDRVGSSTSQFWMSRLDNGTNYCNLNRLVQGSSISSAPGFMEYTNEWLCLGLGLASGCKV